MNYFSCNLKASAIAFALLGSASAFAQSAPYYSTDFKASNPAAIGFSTLDANGDGSTWTTQESTLTFRQLDGNSIDAVEKTPALIAKGNNDDWLFTPSIRFEAGKTYETTFTMAKLMFAQLSNCFEFKLGSEKTAQGMTVDVIPASQCILPEKGGNSLWTLRATIQVGTTGDYYLGLHAFGPMDQKLGITNLRIEKGIGTVTPAAVSNLTVTPDPTGDKRATISFSAPTLAKDGSAISSLSKIEIRRDGDRVETLESVVPGQSYSYTDYVAVSALYEYSVQAFSDAGGGDFASASAFVGVNVPASVPAVRAENTGLRSARITWDAPVLDKDGFPISQSLLTYDLYRKPIYDGENLKIASGLTDLFFDDALPEDAGESQRFYSYSVAAATSQGEALPTVAPSIPMGAPYAAPYSESFPNGRVETMFTSNNLQGNNFWYITRDFEDISAADLDNGMAFLNGQIGGAAAFASPLIDLAGMASPTLGYYTNAITGCDPADNELQLHVYATDGSHKSFDRYAPASGWNKTVIPLDEFSGKVVRLVFDGYRNNNTELFLDGISISNIFRNDLKIASVDLPAKVRSSEPFDVVVNVLNCGSGISGDYEVALFCDGVNVDSYSAAALPVGAYDNVRFTRTHGILDPEEVSYSAEIIYAEDQDPSNNLSGTVATQIRKNSYPTVTDLSGSLADGRLTLAWSEPDTSNAQPYETLETFEQFPAWANANVGDWVFVDRDQAQIAGFVEAVMPGIDAFSKQSWWVFDNSSEDFNNGSFSTLSGSHFLASMVSGIQGQGFVQNDDWAISPALFGGAQTVSVNARSYSLVESEWESFEILWSDGSLNPDDFTLLKRFEAIPSEFAAYEADLPEGARRFAIRNVSEGKYVLMVDDVTYIGTGDPAAFSINGYNVYRDGQRLNSEPVEENEFEITDATDGTYQVSVLYSAGESRLSNPFNPGESSVALTDSEKADAVGLYDLQGRPVSNPSPGIYLRRLGSQTSKIIIR